MRKCYKNAWSCWTRIKVKNTHVGIKQRLKFSKGVHWLGRVNCSRRAGLRQIQLCLQISDKRVLGNSWVEVSHISQAAPPTDGRCWYHVISKVPCSKVPRCKHRTTSVHSLYSILSAISSQWWSRSIVVTWSYFRAPVTSRTDEFRTDCSRRMSHACRQTRKYHVTIVQLRVNNHLQRSGW